MEGFLRTLPAKKKPFPKIKILKTFPLFQQGNKDRYLPLKWGAEMRMWWHFYVVK